MVVKDFLFEGERREREWKRTRVDATGHPILQKNQYNILVFVIRFILFTVNLLAIYLAGDLPVLKEVLYQR